MEKRNRRILRCPVCTMGRIADAPMEADLSQYHLFGMREGEYADLIAKCPKCSAQIGIAVSHCPGRFRCHRQANPRRGTDREITTM